ncbi:protein ANTAGONIST OF LIKE HETEROCHROMATIN PROTEIN 1 [Orussus abietinus]|uniref:protein ANTAGONIST OF LIKE HETEROCHROMATIN PROTEIN 1 n=1 Tax=Orussus abietinus TaxID=222816 RepID=UPI0006255C06|nr:protein ANTAGONIST OF LIKE HETEROCHROMATIN PROTEIN 1 [Orussus abietinus]
MDVQDLLLLFIGSDDVPANPMIRHVEQIINELVDPIPDILNVRGYKRTLKERNNEYFETTIPSYTDIQFKEHFRMTRVACENLVHIIGNEMGERQNDAIPLDKKVLFTLWMISKPESFLAAGDRFNVPPSSAHYIFKEIIMVLSTLRYKHIKWPNNYNKRIIANIFKRRSHGIPGIIGVIDTCHIPCKQPAGNANDYYNKKGFHSIILQGICDHQARFIDCYVGLPGRMHDARVFRSSPIFRRLTNRNNPLLSKDEHLIGDSAYPLMQNLLTPFRDTEQLTRAQVHYNTRFGSIRSIIELAFGHLTWKMRRLKYLDITDFDLGNNIIAAACVLHNYIIDNDDLHDCDVIDTDDDTEIDEVLTVENYEIELQAATEKRNNIVASLYRNI